MKIPSNITNALGDVVLCFKSDEYVLKKTIKIIRKYFKTEFQKLIAQTFINLT